MAARFFSLLACVAAAQAGIIGSPLGVPIGQAGLIGSPLGVARAGLIGSPLGVPIAQAGLIGSPLGARTISGLPLGVSSLGLGARIGVNGLGVASPLIAQQAISPYGLAPQAISPYGLAPRVAVAAPVGIAKTVVSAAVDTDYDPNPSYSYAYDVQDALTGDSKNQQESRQGDVVQGSYSLVEPDGTRRTVEYTADPVNGFNAVVHREPLAVAAVQKTVVAAPAIARVGYGAPIGVASPLGLASPIGVASPYGIGAIGARTIIG